MSARQEFQRHVKGKNIMTPESLEFGFIGDGQLYEITSGTGFDHEPIFGVTVIDRKTGTLQHGVGGMFHSLPHAVEHVGALIDGQGRIRFRRKLTEQELQACVKAAATGIEACLMTFYELALQSIGSSWDEETSIRPGDFQVPFEQVTEIVNASEPWFGLDWMNKGPAAYKQEE